MKVLDLQCANAHVFEGWFGSEQDFQDQLARGFVTCPMCDNAAITKRITAARLNLSGSKAGAAEPAAVQDSSPQVPSPPNDADIAVAAKEAQEALQRFAAGLTPERQAALTKAVREMVSKSTDVGKNFAAEARRIHEGEAPERAIHGQATKAQALELLEDGIPIMPLPDHLTRTLQ